MAACFRHVNSVACHFSSVSCAILWRSCAIHGEQTTPVAGPFRIRIVCMLLDSLYSKRCSILVIISEQLANAQCWLFVPVIIYDGKIPFVHVDISSGKVPNGVIYCLVICVYFDPWLKNMCVF